MNLFSVKWWVNMFITTFVTMIFIYFIKKITKKYQIPVVSTIVDET